MGSISFNESNNREDDNLSCNYWSVITEAVLLVNHFVARQLWRTARYACQRVLHDAQFEMYNVGVETSRPIERRYCGVDVEVYVRQLHTGDVGPQGVAMQIYTESLDQSLAVHRQNMG